MKCKNCGRDNCGMTKIKPPTACYHRAPVLGPCASCVDRHVRDVSNATRDCIAHIQPAQVSPPSPADAVSAKDWMGMWDIARVRADKAEAALAQARKVAAAMDIYYHRQGCPYGMCNCGADAGNKARRELLAILEVHQ